MRHLLSGILIGCLQFSGDDQRGGDDRHLCQRPGGWQAGQGGEVRLGNRGAWLQKTMSMGGDKKYRTILYHIFKRKIIVIVGDR